MSLEAGRGEGRGSEHGCGPACGKPIPPELAQDVARTFEALSDPTRLRLISALSEGELCVGEMAELLEMTPSAISHQLRVLRAWRIVRKRRDGRHVYYTLDDDHILDIYRSGLSHALHS